jgi:hypothetical protein
MEASDWPFYSAPSRCVTVSAAGTASLDPSSLPTLGSFVNAGAQGTYINRPTITYTPLTGDQYVRGMMTPIRPEQLFSAILAGWPANVILFIGVESINGLANQSFGRMAQRSADPRFLRLLELTRKLQLSGALGFRIREAKEKDTKNLIFFRDQNPTEEEIPTSRRVGPRREWLSRPAKPRVFDSCISTALRRRRRTPTCPSGIATTGSGSTLAISNPNRVLRFSC